MLCREASQRDRRPTLLSVKNRVKYPARMRSGCGH
jgi:hypothetical protein